MLVATRPGPEAALQHIGPSPAGSRIQPRLNAGPGISRNRKKPKTFATLPTNQRRMQRVTRVHRR